MTVRRVALVALVTAAWLLTAISTAGDASADPGPADAALSDCVARDGGLSVLFLMDESASLQRTDPTGVRADAVESALRALEVRSRLGSLGAATRITVAFGSFSVSYDQTLEWTSLRPESMDRVLEVARGVAATPRGHDTDYVAALQGAQAALATAPEACRAVLWFTDGEFDLDANNRARVLGEAGASKPWIEAEGLTSEDGSSIDLRVAADADLAMEAGRGLICRPGGLADAARQSGAVTFPVGLSVNGGITPDALAFLNGVADGSNGCGELGSLATGRVVLAEDVGQLVRQFAELVLPQGEPIDRVLTLDPLVGRAVVLVERGSELLPVSLVAPTGEELPLGFVDVGEVRVAEADVRVLAVSEEVALLDIAPDPLARNWIGDWNLRFDPTRPEDAAISAFFFLAADIEVDTTTRLRQDSAVAVEIGVVNSAGLAISPDEVDLVVSLSSGGGEPVVLSPVDGRWVADITAANGGGEIEFVATAEVENLDGREFDQVVKRFRLAVDLPAGFIDVGTALDASLLGDESAEVVVPLSAGPESAGCVAVLAASAVSGLVEVEPTQERVCLEAGESADLRFVIRQADPVIGTDRVVIDLVVDSQILGESRAVSRSSDVSLDRPVDEQRRWLLFVALLLAGILVPLLLMSLLSRIQARHRDPRELQIAQTEVELDSGGSIVTAGEDRLVIDPESLRYRVTQSSARVLVANGATLRARAPMSPFAAPYVEGTLAGSTLVGAFPGRRGSVRLPLGLNQAWWIVPSATAGRGTLNTLVRHSADLENIERDVHRLAPPQLRAISESNPEPQPSSPSVPEDGVPKWQAEDAGPTARPPKLDLGPPDSRNTRPPEWKP